MVYRSDGLQTVRPVAGGLKAAGNAEVEQRDAVT